MAFGSTLKEQSTAKSNVKSDPIFLNLKEGTRVIRVIGNEFQIKQHWLEVKVKNGDQIVTAERPVTVGVLSGGSFVGADGEYFGNNPWDKHLQTLPKESQKWARTRFYANVIDRTPVIRKDGEIYYPDANDKYSVEGIPEPHNAVMILEGSAGKEGGKHFLQSIVTVASMLRDIKTGAKIGLDQSDIMIITKGKGIDTVRTVMPSFQQDVIDTPVLYDLDSFCKPWPYDAIQDLMDGAEYNETRQKYNLPAFPQKFS